LYTIVLVGEIALGEITSIAVKTKKLTSHEKIDAQLLGKKETKYRVYPLKYFSDLDPHSSQVSKFYKPG
jgi:hypothetical protein